MVQIAKLFGGVLQDEAAVLADAIDKIESGREIARRREQELALARVEALLTGEDAQIDSIEKDLSAVQRQLDRYEVQLPELRRRHARQNSIETFEANTKKFDALVVERVAAAREIDGALIGLGKIFEKFEATSEKLLELQPFHQSTGPDGGGDVRRASPRRVIMASFLHAPLFARVFGAKSFVEKLETFASGEAIYWAEIQRKLKQKDPSNIGDMS